MMRSDEGCIREDKSNFRVYSDFPLPLGPDNTIENGCWKVSGGEENASGIELRSVYFSYEDKSYRFC